MSSTPSGSDTREIIAVDLFCGAGGFSQALRNACDELGYELKHAAINHWEAAIESHKANHPDADHYHCKIENPNPHDVIDALVDEDVDDVHAADVNVDLLVAGPECTHFSSARGGKPVKEQKRMGAWQLLGWVQKASPDVLIVENVGEIRSWGPIEDGQPTRDGTVFEAWVNAMNSLGYSVDWTTLNAANFGDPTSRERFFLIGRQDGKATFPEPTHSDDDPELPDRRTAAEIIDWSDPGQSIWTRDITEPRIHTPPKDTTMERIAEGIRRHCDDRLEPFADALEGMGRDAIRHLRNERVVSPEQAHTAAAMQDEPFLVPVNGATVESVPYVLGQHSNSVARDVDERPVPTVAKGGGLQLCDAQSFLLRQQDGGNPWSISERPLPTIPTKGAHAIATPALIRPKNGIQGDKYSNSVYPAASRPHHTVISDPRSMLTCPSLVRWSHGGATLSFDDPMPTIATERGGVFSLSKPVVKPFIDDCQGKAQATDKPLKTQPGSDRYALCVPEIWPYGLDIKYRMLQPDELKQAQGFSPDFEIVGTKRDKTKQIGNAVPVNLATALCKHVLTAENPSLASFGGGISKPEDSTVPDYDEVVGDD